MQVFVKENLAFLAVPKTGTTAYEMALRGAADIVFRGRLKHMTAGRFHSRMAPFLADTYRIVPERLAVMRDPVDQIRSWYKYRSAPERIDTPRGTGGMSFDAYVEAVISDDPPPCAGIGSQYAFLTSGKGRLLVHSLFAYERQDDLRAYLEDRFRGPLRLRRKNVSPDRAAPLDPGVERRLRAARAAEFDLYDRLIAAGGYLETPDL